MPCTCQALLNRNKPDYCTASAQSLAPGAEGRPHGVCAELGHFSDPHVSRIEEVTTVLTPEAQVKLGVEAGPRLELLCCGGVAEVFHRLDNLERWVDRARGLKD